MSKPFPTSISTPNLATPQRPSTPKSPQTYVHYPNYTPTSTSHPRNTHPYLIQSTSSSLLTRSNTSPSPAQTTDLKHRSSRSMSSLSGSGMAYQGLSESESELTPSKSKSKRLSSPLPAVAAIHQYQQPDVDPKLWTPSQLATYLGSVLRSGHQGGQVVPGPVVEDIKSWVLRHQVGGREFMNGDIGHSRPPPFLPLLQSISRRLKRSSFQGPAVMEEEDEGSGEMTGVKRMASVFDARGFASDASGSVSGASGDESWDERQGKIVKVEKTGRNEVTDDPDKGRKKTEHVPDLELVGASPPPPYASPHENDLDHDQEQDDPSSRSILDVDQRSTPGPVVPTPTTMTTTTTTTVPIAAEQTIGLGIQTPTQLTPRSTSAYSTLRRSSRPIPSLALEPSSSSSENKSSTRRVSTRGRRKREMEVQMAILMERIKELENLVQQRQTTTSGGGNAGEDNRPLPVRIRELPGYLFLIGVGVGVVVARVLFRRSL